MTSNYWDWEKQALDPTLPVDSDDQQLSLTVLRRSQRVAGLGMQAPTPGKSAPGCWRQSEGWQLMCQGPANPEDWAGNPEIWDWTSACCSLAVGLGKNHLPSLTQCPHLFL